MHALKYTVIVLLLLALCGAGRVEAAQPKPMLDLHTQAESLLPYVDYIIDPSMGMDIEEVARAGGWRPYVNNRLPREEGLLWLRFTIAPVPADAKKQTYLLDMGSSVPGTATLYEAVVNELAGTTEWRENLPSRRNIILLPEALPESQVCYIRINGLPGPWFSPMIRTPHDAATNWSSLIRPAAILALGVVVLLCLLRGLSEKGQWRYWTGLFVAAAFAQALLGMPVAMEKYSAWDLAAILLPGITLMLLPHVGRHLMGSRANARSIDIQLFLLSFIGAVMALLPLVPGWKWLDRWLELWPMGAALFLPTALGAWMSGLPGSRRFLLACFILPVFTGVALLGLEFGLPANILASGPVWGVGLAALILVAASMAQGKAEPEKQREESKNAMRLETDPIINLEHPLDDPNLRLIPTSMEEAATPAPPPLLVADADAVPPLPQAFEENPDLLRQAEARELALRQQIEDIMKETAALGHCALPPSARKSVESLNAASNRVANILSRPGLPPASLNTPAEEPAEEIFNLQKIMRNAHDAVASTAEFSGITLSWYMPPHLGPLFRGPGEMLESVLARLLESATRATGKGAVKLSARRVPQSKDNGHLLFTIEDEGQGYPPKSRSSLALVRAWELAGQTGGYISMESTATGATISFSAHLTPLSEPNEALDEALPQKIIVAASDRDARRKIKRIVESAGMETVDCESAREVAAAQAKGPAPLLIAQGSFARPASADMVREFMRQAKQAGFAKPNAVAVTPDQSQWRLLKTSGFTHAMLEPVDPEALRRTIGKLLETAPAATVASEQPAPEVTPERQPDKEQTANGNAGDDERVPTMLVEQSYQLATTFEGPDWLGGMDQSEPATNQPEAASSATSATPVNGSPQVADGAPPAAASTTSEGEAVPASGLTNPPEAKAHEARERDGLSVGLDRAEGQAERHKQMEREVETQPQSDAHADDLSLRQTGSHGEEATASPVLAAAAPDSMQEWVGEPMPIGSPVSEKAARFMAERAARTQGAETGASENSASDRQAHVASSPDSMAAAAVSQDSEAVDAASPLKDFMHTSVSMVTHTLSSMLKQNAPRTDAAATPSGETLQLAEKDGSMQNQPEPGIQGLLARLDEALDQAKAAFSTGNNPAVATASSLVAREAEDFGLRPLGRLADSLSRAARDNNMGAMGDLLMELASAIEQNRIALVQKSKAPEELPE